MRTPPILAAILLLALSLSGCGTETMASADTDVTAIKLALMQFADGRMPDVDPDPVNECTCGGTGRSGDGLGPCICGGNCTCAKTDNLADAGDAAPDPPPEDPVAPVVPFNEADDEPQTLEAPADLPVVTCYVTRNCSACDDVKRWHTDDLPFRVEFVMDDRLEPHPWFEWEVNGVRLRWPHKGRLDQSIDRDYVVRVWEHSHTPGVVSAPAKTEERPTAQPSRRMQYAAPNYTRPVYSYQPAQWFTGRFRSSQACRTCR
jgi:hypothetical protein